MKFLRINSVSTVQCPLSSVRPGSSNPTIPWGSLLLLHIPQLFFSPKSSFLLLWQIWKVRECNNEPDHKQELYAFFFSYHYDFYVNFLHGKLSPSRQVSGANLSSSVFQFHILFPIRDSRFWCAEAAATFSGVAENIFLYFLGSHQMLM